MSDTASQITGVSIVDSTICLGADQRKHQSIASLAFVRGIHRWLVDSPHIGPVTFKMFPFDNVVFKTCYQKIITWSRETVEFVVYIWYRSEIWQTPSQQWCWNVCQLSHRFDNYRYTYRSFESLRRRSHDKTSCRVLKPFPETMCSYLLTVLKFWKIFTGPTSKLFFSLTVVSDVYSFFIPNETAFTIFLSRFQGSPGALKSYE